MLASLIGQIFCSGGGAAFLAPYFSCGPIFMVTLFYDTNRAKKQTKCLTLMEIFSTLEWIQK